MSEYQEDRNVNVIRKSLEEYETGMPFSVYMNRVLYGNDIGYYRFANPAIGSAGDFVTAPEISSLFALCMAESFVQVLKNYTCPCVLELGAGSGQFAVDVLSAMGELGLVPERYYILEPSATLVEQQKACIKSRLPYYYSRVYWLSRLPREPIDGVVFANEVVDALPVTLFSKSAGQCWQYHVTAADQGGLAWHRVPAEPELAEAVAAIESRCGVLADGYCSEVNLWLPGWLQSLAEVLRHGVMLVCDYGYVQRDYYHPQRSMGTLRCYYRHKTEDDPLKRPGLQDITAHVDFTALAEAAVQAGFELEGYTSQAAFLLENGFERKYAQRMRAASPSHQLDLRSAQKLVRPEAMGEVFKVMALSKGDYAGELDGFELQEYSHLL